MQAAIGNLLRNAIENSGRGHIELQLSASAVLTLQDPGHGMSRRRLPPSTRAWPVADAPIVAAALAWT